MANIWNIASKGLLATGISGFPVGVSSFAHSSKFSNNKQISAQKAALEQSKIFLENEIKKLKEKTETKPTPEEKKKQELKDWKVKLEKKEKESAQGTDDDAKGASIELQKMVKKGIYSCQDYENKGLTQVTEKFKFGDEEREITYCYYSECDGKLFFKNTFDNPISDSEEVVSFRGKEGCFSVSLKHEDSKIKGNIKFGFKSGTWTNERTHNKKAVLFITTIEFHKNNPENNKFKNTFIYLKSEKNNSEWKAKERHEWDDSHKSEYTYDRLKDKFSGEFKKLEIWKKRPNNVYDGITPEKKKQENLMRNMLEKLNLNLFDRGSDLWNWEQSNIENKSHFENWNDKIWWHVVNYNRILENDGQTRDRFGVWEENYS